MPATSVYVDTQKVRNSASTLRNANTKLRTKLEEAQSVINSVNTEEVYKTPASDEMAQKFITMANKRFPEFEEIVESYAKALDDVAETHDNLVNSTVLNLESSVEPFV